MTTHTSQQTEIITKATRLQEVAANLNAQTEIAVDLEMDSLHHYREKVCLIQISTRTESWLIDPLSLDSVDCLKDPLHNPEIQIVMHGADYDIRSLHRDFGLEVTALFDTMIASRFLGIMEFGLAALLKSRFDIQLDKKYQKADWSKRPLTEEMCRYAVADTSTLLPLYDQLALEIREKGREIWLKEECSLVCQARVTEKEGPFYLACKGAGKLKGEGLTILEQLLVLRDQQANKLDRPPFKVLAPETLLEISEKRPQTGNDLAAIKGMTPGQIARFGESILAAVSDSLALPPEKQLKFPRTQRPETSEGSKERLKRLKGWRDEFSRQLALDPGVIAPNWLLEQLSEAKPTILPDLDSITGMREWQKKLYGETLLALVNE